MNLKTFHVVQLAVRTGSFTLAAQTAKVSQSAVTQAVKALEAQLGIPLFERDGRRKRPTQAALAIAQCADEMEARLRWIYAVPKAPEENTLRIGISAGAAIAYGPLIATTWQRATQEEGRVVMGSGSAPDLLRMLRGGELDLVVAPRPRAFALDDLDVDVLFSSTPIIHARIGHPLAGARSLSELKEVGWVVVGRGDTPSAMIEEAYRVRQLGRAKVVVQCSDYKTCLHLIGKSDLMAVIPSAHLTDADQMSRLVQVNTTEGLPRYDVCLFRTRGPQSAAKAGVAFVASALLGEVDASKRRGPRGRRRTALAPAPDGAFR